jgi:hypothetical protein
MFCVSWRLFTNAKVMLLQCMECSKLHVVMSSRQGAIAVDVLA